ncbi:MAG: hypothetical protein J5919_08270 [Clostridia bacterium]|nr:hypothetical protein [Clostridia bacterium]
MRDAVVGGQSHGLRPSAAIALRAEDADVAGAIDCFRTIASGFALLYGNDHPFQLRSENFLEAVEYVLDPSPDKGRTYTAEPLRTSLRHHLFSHAPWSEIRLAGPDCVRSCSRIERACRCTYDLFCGHVYGIARR